VYIRPFSAGPIRPSRLLLQKDIEKTFDREKKMTSGVKSPFNNSDRELAQQREPKSKSESLQAESSQEETTEHYLEENELLLDLTSKGNRNKAEEADLDASRCFVSWDGHLYYF